MDWWIVAAVMNGVILVAYLAISITIGRGLIGSGQWRSNPLAAATSAIFFTCAVHHGSHTVHMLLPAFDLERSSGLAMRDALNDWHASGWDIVAAAVSVWYWTLRGRFPALVRGAALFEDVRQRQRQAIDIHDNVVQGLAVAKMSLELGRTDEALQAIETTLGAARTIITDLLGTEGTALELEPGDLRRTTSAIGT